MFAERAAQHDREGSFPFENFEELREAGILAMTVPGRFGGGEASLGTYLAMIGELARGDGSTALALNMHLIRFGAEREAPTYPERWFEEMCRGAVEEGRLCNTAATEEGLGSPAGGGVPETVAKRDNDSWVLNGRKTFTTMAPALHYFIVLATVPGEDGPGLANFMVLRGDAGISVAETWDSLGMRATGSHDLVLEDVRLDTSRLLNSRDPRKGDSRGGSAFTWFALGVSSVSLGVAHAARDYAVQFARERTPNSTRTIKEYPGVRQRIARIDLLLQRSRALIGDAAVAWESRGGERAGMAAIDRVAVAKVDTMNSCIEAVDLAMRVVGGVSLQKSRPIERYYRDVRAPLHNPPLEDRALEQLARSALDEPPEPPKAVE